MSFTAEKIMYENTAKIKMCANQFPKTEKIVICRLYIGTEIPMELSVNKGKSYRIFPEGLTATEYPEFAQRKSVVLYSIER